MLRSDEQWLGIADAFGTAAFDGNWYTALEALADACGFRTGQLVGFGSDNVTFNYWTGVDPEIVEEFAEIGGGNPALNPRVRAGNAVPELTVLAEGDFLTPDEYRNNEIYTWGRARDLSYSCLSPLIHSNGDLVGLAVIRSQAEGHVEDAERAIFASLAPHVRAAVRTRMLLEGKAMALLTGTLESLSLAAFVCDAAGRVVALTPLAEQQLVRGRLRLQNGRLAAATDADTRALQAAIAAAASRITRPGPPLQATLVVHGTVERETPVALDVIALPQSARDFASAPRAVVTVRGNHREESALASVLRTAWGLTESEAQVAVMLTGGKSIAEIAEAREVKVGTVRIQTKSIYAKLGVNRQAELSARLSPLL